MQARPRCSHSGSPLRFREAFTLIELLVAAAIAGLLMMTAIPFARDVRKTPLVRAVNSMVEACRQARLKSILLDHPMQVVIYDNGGAIGVERVPQRGRINPSPYETGFEDSETGMVSTAKAAIFEAHIDDEVAFRQLLVNGRDLMAEAAIAIRFYPNGTSDAFAAELQWLRHDARRITVDIMTGQPTVEAAP